MSQACRRSDDTSCLFYMWKTLLPESRYSGHIAYAIVLFLCEQEEGFPRGYIMYVGSSGVDCCVFQYMRVVAPFYISELKKQWLVEVSWTSIHRFGNLYSTVDLKYSNLEIGTDSQSHLKGIILLSEAMARCLYKWYRKFSLSVISITLQSSYITKTFHFSALFFFISRDHEFYRLAPS